MQRSYLFDNIKAILIFSVVIAHFIRVSGSFDSATFGGVVYITSFSFIMQGFLFISGYFSKNVDKCRLGAAKNFLLPYVLLMPIMMAFRYVLFGHATLDFMVPSIALWFLLVMFVYRFSIKTLAKIPFILPLSFMLFLLSGCMPFLGEEFALGRICSFLIFFMLGYKCEAKHIEAVRRISKKITVPLLILLIGFSLVMAYSELLPVEMWHLKEGYTVYHISNVAGVFIRLGIGVVSMGWLIVFFNLVSDKETFMSAIGRRTMAIYILHIPVRYMIKASGIIGDGNALYYIIILGITLLCIKVFSAPGITRAYNEIIDFIYDTLIVGGTKEIIYWTKRVKYGIVKKTHNN